MSPLSRALLLLALLMLIALGSARLPAVGDHVSISVMGDKTRFEYKGNITDIDSNMICLNCTEFSYVTTETFSDGSYAQFLRPDLAHEKYGKPFEICIGKGSVIGLGWI